MALVVALWGAAILAIVTMSVLELTRADSRVEHGQADAVQLGAVADASINIAVLAMLGPAGTRPPVTGKPFTVTFDGYQAQLTVLDETGKPDLNLASATVLRLMLGAAGLDSALAEATAARIIARRTTGPGDRRAQPFQSIAELRTVPGLTASAYRRLSSSVTIYSRTPYLDPAYASVATLTVFRNVDRSAADRLQQLGEEARGRRDAAPAAKLVPGHAYTITATVSGARGTRASRRAVIRITGQPRAPLLVYEWN